MTVYRARTGRRQRESVYARPPLAHKVEGIAGECGAEHEDPRTRELVVCRREITHMSASGDIFGCLHCCDVAQRERIRLERLAAESFVDRLLRCAPRRSPRHGYPKKRSSNPRQFWNVRYPS